MSIDYEFPPIWFKHPFIEGDTISEYFPNPDAKDGKWKVNSIELKTPFVLETARKDINIESMCVVKEHGQYRIQLLSESEGEIMMEVKISRDLLKILVFAVSQYEEVNPDE